MIIHLFEIVEDKIKTMKSRATKFLIKDLNHLLYLAELRQKELDYIKEQESHNKNEI